MTLTNEQWSVVSKFIAKERSSTSKRGRPPLDKRQVVDAILWVLARGARWKEMPNYYPQYQTCRNYYYEWHKTGAMERVLKVLAAAEAQEEDASDLGFDIGLADGHSPSKKKLSEFVKKIEACKQKPDLFSAMQYQVDI